MIIIVKLNIHPNTNRSQFRTYAAAPTLSHNVADLSAMGGGRYQPLQPAEPIRNAEPAAIVCVAAVVAAGVDEASLCDRRSTKLNINATRSARLAASRRYVEPPDPVTPRRPPTDDFRFRFVDSLRWSSTSRDFIMTSSSSCR